MSSNTIKKINYNNTEYSIAADFDGGGNEIASTYLPLTGGTITGDLKIANCCITNTWFSSDTYSDYNGDRILTTNRDTETITLGDQDNTYTVLNVGTSNSSLNLYGSNSKTSYNGEIIPTTGGTTTTVGSSTKPVYVNNGVLTASSSTIGSSTKPVYLNSGTITALSSTIGADDLPVYLASGTITTATNILSSLINYVNTTSMTGAFELAYDIGVNPSHASGTPTLWPNKYIKGSKVLFIRAGRFLKNSGDIRAASYSFIKPMYLPATPAISNPYEAPLYLMATNVVVQLTAGPGMSTDSAYVGAVSVASTSNSTSSTYIKESATYSGFKYNACNSEVGYVYYLAIGYTASATI